MAVISGPAIHDADEMLQSNAILAAIECSLRLIAHSNAGRA
jgi:hypothetical protein